MILRMLVRPAPALLAICLGACASVTVDDPWTELADPGALPVRQIAAMETLGATPDERYVEALESVMWRPGYTTPVREAALERLEVLDPEGLQRSVRLRLPNLGIWGWLERLCAIIAERGWTEQTPALISSWARHVVLQTDYRNRPEYRALAALHGEEQVVGVVFATFVETTEVAKQGLRLRCWELLHHLGERERLVQIIRGVEPSPDDLLLLDLQAGAEELGIVPDRREEIIWMRTLRQPEHAALWSLAREGCGRLPARERAVLRMRDLPVVAAAAVHEPELLETPRERLFDQIEAELRDREHHSHESAHAQDTAQRSMHISSYRDDLTWGDLAALRLAIRALEVPQVVGHLFDYADRDHEDRTTEYGGIIRLDERNRFEVLEFPPRVREHDQKFVASRDMFKASYDAIFHFHNHVQKHRNKLYAGPGYGDLVYADQVRANALVFTFVDRDTMNVDYYRHDRVVVDLGVIRRSAG
jgi:hypothetical protein